MRDLKALPQNCTIIHQNCMKIHQSCMWFIKSVLQKNVSHEGSFFLERVQHFWGIQYIFEEPVMRNSLLIQFWGILIPHLLMVIMKNLNRKFLKTVVHFWGKPIPQWPLDFSDKKNYLTKLIFLKCVHCILSRNYLLGHTSPWTFF